jgi:hypothetical protein
MIYDHDGTLLSKQFLESILWKSHARNTNRCNFFVRLYPSVGRKPIPTFSIFLLSRASALPSHPSFLAIQPPTNDKYRIVSHVANMLETANGSDRKSAAYLPLIFNELQKLAVGEMIFSTQTQ